MSNWSNRRYFSSALACGLIAIVLALTSACSRTTNNKGGSAGTAAASEARSVDVTTASAATREVPAFLQATGSFAADESSDVAPDTSGRIIATPVDVGAYVGAGSVIARLDPRDAQFRLQQALGNEKQAAGVVRQAEAKLGLDGNGKFRADTIPEVRAARAAYESAQAQARLAEVEARRYANLVETGDVARSAYDQARTQAETAREQANAARQQYEATLNTARQNNQAIATARGTLDAARSQVAIAQKAVSDTVIKAPFAGYISDRPIAVGEYVTPASRIATLLRTNPIKLRLQVPEMEVSRVRAGTNVSVSVDAYPDRQFAGQVTAVNPAIDPTSRAITVEADVANPENLLRPGMFATARVTQPGGQQAVYVPRNAVLFDANTNSSRVFVVDGDKVRLIVVQVGEQENEIVRITSGLAGGETVATSNLEQLFEGASVRRQ
jgi:membrane fusion protein, multidrug efflux system